MKSKVVYGDNMAIWGEFVEGCAGFNIKSLNLPAPWDYIYQNKDILLKVDQYGPVYAQAYPPGDVMLFKRENDQKYSNWVVWLNSPDFSDNTPFTNFFRPLADQRKPTVQPDDFQVCYRPDNAVYEFSHQGLHLRTEFFVPLIGTEIVMKLRIKNNRPQNIELSLYPTVVPYVNPAQLAPWDKYEWYLKTGFGRNEKDMFWSQLLNMNSESSKRRTAVLWTDSEYLDSFEVSYEKFIGSGSITCPQGVLDGSLRISPAEEGDFGEYKEKNTVYGYPPVYAARYKWLLKPGEERTLTQVLCMPPNSKDGGLPEASIAKSPLKYFNTDIYKKEKDKTAKFFKSLTAKNTVGTGNEVFDYYINNWLPLQMNWVASLDRGWPSGMRGTRDSANDFTALLQISPEDCKSVLLTMLSCQKSNGWFPRQYSAQGRKGTHDLRGHVDGGVFVIEFFYMYLCHTGDLAILDETQPWLDSDRESTVMEHIIAAMEYYLAPENIGEHGLCKLGEGDWLDAVNRAGTLGRGESVMVTNQAIISLKYMAEIFRYTGLHVEKIPVYMDKINWFEQNLIKHAYNKNGFFNSVFNDSGKWIFSDCDPDGEERPYGPANWYSVSSGIAIKNSEAVVHNVMDKLRSEFGYRLYWPPMGKNPIPNVGRVGSGDAPSGLAENGNAYNHGSHGFLVRALANIGDGNNLFDVLTYMLPYDQQKHPTQLVMSSPYAIVNCWQDIPVFKHRGMLSFLTGSVAMVMRGVYEWMMGIKPCLEGLAIDPCIPGFFRNPKARFTFRGRVIELEIDNPSGRNVLPDRVTVNGLPVTQKREDPFNKREVFVIAPELLSCKANKILVHM
ncbi:MAG TPA: hypothetical protein VHP38_00110 [Ruminiclostridium sp.]|nr:hypothetical protein [Ruminiclostridium sp.]